MATTYVDGNGGVRVGGEATVSFTHGSREKADADIQVLWDFDNDDDFNPSLEVLESFAQPGGDLYGLAWDGEALWVAEWSETVYRVDPADGSTLGTITVTGVDVLDVVWDGSHLWATDWDAGEFYRVDPSGGSVLATFTAPGAEPYGIAWDGEHLWVSDMADQAVYKVAPADGSTVDSFETSFTPGCIEWVDGVLWVANTDTGEVHKIRPDGAVLATVPAIGDFAEGLAWDGGHLWHGVYDGGATIYKLEVVDVEDVTPYLVSLETSIGRDWPSQVHGTVGPGRLRMTLVNTDDRFSIFNPDSPLNQAPYSLDVGRKIRVQVAGAEDPDPKLLVRDRFDRADTESGQLGVAETGQAWAATTFSDMHVEDGQAKAFTEGATHTYTIDAGVADYYMQVTVTNPFDQVDPTGAFSPSQTNGDAGIVFRYADGNNYQLFRVVPDFDAGNGFVEFEVVDVVAGTPTTVASGMHDVIRKDITMGVRVDGSVYGAYVEGVQIFTGTARQTSATNVGLYTTRGVGNSVPAFDDFYVWDRMREAKDGILWTGRITDVKPSVQLGPRKFVTVDAEGVFSDLASRNIKPEGRPWPWATGYSVGEALVKAGVMYPPPRAATIDGLFYGIAFGDQRIGAIGYGSEGVSALEHCRTVEGVEFGFFHETPEGWASFHRRGERDTQEAKATFSDIPGDQFGYSDIELLDSKREIVNHVKVGISARPPTPQVTVAIAGSTAAGVPNPVRVTLPTGIEEGDLLIVFFVSTVRNANENWIVPIWWQRLRDTGGSVTPRMQVYAHVCDGTEDNTQVTFYTDSNSAGGAWVGLMWHIRDWYGVIDDGVQIGDPARGNSSAGANPAPLLPRWGVTNSTLFLAQRTGGNVSGSGAGSINSPTYPLGYRGCNTTFQDGTANQFDCAEQHGARFAITTVEDPGGFSGFSGIGNAEANLVAVRAYNGDPPERNGRYLLEFHDRDSQARVGAIRTFEGPTYFQNEDDAEEYAQLILDRYATDRPIVRIRFHGNTNAAYRSQAVRRRVGQKIHLTANRTTGVGIDGDFYIENIAHRFSAGGTKWEVTWELSPA